jgi:large-conductance mechanosensitive channel
MISFLLEEGVITVGTISGLFTAAMLNSFRVNILEPSIENLVPSYKLDPFTSTSLGNIINPPVTIAEQRIKGHVKWQTFLRDFITWLILMFCLYIFWKKVLHKYKKS